MPNALGKVVAEERHKKIATPQRERTPGRTDEVENSAGGFVFEVSDKNRLERVLILGTDGGSYYASETELSESAVKFLRKMIVEDESLVLETLVDVSVNARAYRNSPALFTLALLLSEGKNKAAARDAVNKVARTSTHLFELAEYIESLGGWGRAKRQAIAGWYESKTPEALAYQVVKYRSRTV